MRTLAHPSRLRIIHRLAGGPVEVGRIAADLGHQPTQRLAAPRGHARVGIVEAERAGREVRYRLSDPGIVAACELMRGVLGRRLARLAGLLGRVADRPRARRPGREPADRLSPLDRLEVTRWTNP